MDESIFKSVNKINLLVLDIDEVLNCSKNRYKDSQHKDITFSGQTMGDKYHPDLVASMNSLITRYNMKIVVSSSWRKLFDLITLREILNNQMGLVGEILDYTTKRYLDYGYKDRYEDNPTEARAWDRGLQITDWLSERKYNINNYLVIDDGVDASYGHENNFHRTFGDRGFDLSSYNECITKFDSMFLI